MSNEEADGSSKYQGEVAELVASEPPSPSGQGTEYQSQGGATPSYARSENPSLSEQHESSSDSLPPRPGAPSPIQVHPQRPPAMVQLPQRPAVFTPADEAAPTRAELVTFVTEVNAYITRVTTLYDYLQVPAADRPADPGIAVAQNVANAATIWRIAAQATAAVNVFEAHILAFRLQEAHNIAAAALAAIPPAPAAPAPRCAKTSVPSKYQGKRGDPAATFMTACFNYWQMEQQHFDNENHYIRWVLQLLEGDAGPWAHRQLTRMEDERVATGRITS